MKCLTKQFSFELNCFSGSSLVSIARFLLHVYRKTNPVRQSVKVLLYHSIDQTNQAEGSSMEIDRGMLCADLEDEL